MIGSYGYGFPPSGSIVTGGYGLGLSSPRETFRGVLSIDGRAISSLPLASHASSFLAMLQRGDSDLFLQRGRKEDLSIQTGMEKELQMWQT